MKTIRSIGAITLISFVVSACGQDQQAREPITRGSSAATKNQDSIGFGKMKDKCPLSEMSELIKKSENKIVRLVTTDLGLIDATSDVSKAANNVDTRLLAQAIQSGVVEGLDYAAVTAKRAAELVDVLNVVSQEKCDKVTLKDASGKTQVFAITSGEKSPKKIVLKSTTGNLEYRLIQISGDQIIVTSLKAVDGMQICGTKHNNLMLREQIEIGFGGVNSGRASISPTLVQLLAEHTAASDSIKAQYESLKKGANAVNKSGQRDRGATAKVALSETAVIEAFQKAQAGKLTNASCP